MKTRYLAGPRLVPLLFLTASFLLPVVYWLCSFGRPSAQTGLSGALLALVTRRTHVVAALVGLITVVVAAPAAMAGKFSRQWIGVPILLAVFLPLSLGMLARNYAWVGLLSESSALVSMGWSVLGNGQLAHTEAAVGVVMVFVFLPWAVFVEFVALGVVRSVHVEAARTLGASDLEILRRVKAPALARGMLVAFFLVYASALGYFITPKIVGPNQSDLAGNLILDFVELGDLAIGSYVAVVFLASVLPLAAVFLWLVIWRSGWFSWEH